MIILVINCGSSSAKYELLDVPRNCALARGVVERIGPTGSVLSHQCRSRSLKRPLKCRDHYVAIEVISGILTDARYGAVRSKDEIEGVGHRVVHGGEEFKGSTLITPRVVKYIERYSELAPLHNPPALLGIRACRSIFKGVPQVAVFDTSFHQTMPAKAFLYGLPYKFYRRYGIRKYGFHGTSHKFVSEEAARILKRPIGRLKMVTCHLGNGCSMAAVDGGISVDTTMGFTPLEGLLMGTRSGDLDPAVVFYLMDKEGLSPDRISDILNKQSGLFGVSGVSNDMRDIRKAASGRGEAARRSRLALELFIYRIEKYIGAYQASMGGLDAVIFTAGIGENCPWLIERIRKELKGVVPAKTRFMVVSTDEELLIARDAYAIIKKGE